MAERPIPILPDEAEHLLYKRKTQLRRPIAPAPAGAPSPESCPLAAVGDLLATVEEGPPKLARGAKLRVTAVRAEKLQAITNADALAEGWKEVAGLQPSRSRFQEWWNRSAGKLGAKWSDDPWVWVIAFERI